MSHICVISHMTITITRDVSYLRIDMTWQCLDLCMMQTCVRRSYISLYITSDHWLVSTMCLSQPTNDVAIVGKIRDAYLCDLSLKCAAVHSQPICNLQVSHVQPNFHKSTCVIFPENSVVACQTHVKDAWPRFGTECAQSCNSTSFFDMSKRRARDDIG